MSVRFRFDWVDVAQHPVGADWRTMAQFSIKVGSSTVTSVVDKQSRVYRGHVVVPMFHVAEWLVTNWWHLWDEVQDTRQQRSGYASRHNLSFAGDGYILPDLEIVPVSERVQLRWRRWKPRHSRIEFVDASEVQAGRQQVEAELRSIVDAVLDRLRSFEDCELAAEKLGSAWDAINSMDSDEQESSRAAALLGIDPFDVGDSEAAEIAAFWDRFDPAIRQEVLASATDGSLTTVSNWLDEGLHALEEMQCENDWAAIRNAVRSQPATEPWKQGYELARSVRNELDAGDGRFDFQSEGSLALPHKVAESPSDRIEGLVAPNTPACITVHKPQSGSRFLLARALADYLGRVESSPGILSSLATDRQARSRAFAAEFLAPAQSLRVRLDKEFADEDVIDDLGNEYGVSSYVIAHQIKNHNLAKLSFDDAAPH